MSAGVLAALLGAGGLGAIFAAIVTGLFSKRKLGAEATEIITKAAAGVVTNLQAEVDRQVQRTERMMAHHSAEIRSLVLGVRREREESRRVAQLHAAWDAMARAKLIENGIDIPPVPPLTLPYTFDLPDVDDSV